MELNGRSSPQMLRRYGARARRTCDRTWSASTDHTTRLRAGVQATARSRPPPARGERRRTLAAQPAETRPRLAHAAFRRRQFSSSCDDRLVLPRTAAAADSPSQLNDLEVPRSASYSHAEMRALRIRILMRWFVCRYPDRSDRQFRIVIHDRVPNIDSALEDRQCKCHARRPYQ